MDALRAGPDATPPNNMKQALIFNGSTIAATAFMFLIGFRGEQKRRELDLEKLHEVEEIEGHGASQDTAPVSSIE
ncbi:13420_t:CDS:1, partial [Acaulospora colombiana]